MCAGLRASCPGSIWDTRDESNACLSSAFWKTMLNLYYNGTDSLVAKQEVVVLLHFVWSPPHSSMCIASYMYQSNGFLTLVRPLSRPSMIISSGIDKRKRQHYLCTPFAPDSHVNKGWIQDTRSTTTPLQSKAGGQENT